MITLYFSTLSRKGQDFRKKFYSRERVCFDYYYLAGCPVFHIFLRPFRNHAIFLLQLFLSPQSSSFNPFSPIIPLIPSAHVSLGQPRFLLADGRHSSTSFGSLPSSILWTCPYH